MTGRSEVILHSKTLLAETLLQTAPRAMIQFHLPDKSPYRTNPLLGRSSVTALIVQVDDVRPKVPGTPFVNTDAFPHKILACIQGYYIPYGQDSCVLFMLVNQGLSATSAQRLTGMAALRL